MAAVKGAPAAEAEEAVAAAERKPRRLRAAVKGAPADVAEEAVGCSSGSPGG